MNINLKLSLQWPEKSEDVVGQRAQGIPVLDLLSLS